MDETLAEEVQNCDYVRRVSKQIGVTLEPEKLTETSTYRSAETVLYQVKECHFLCDLDINAFYQIGGPSIDGGNLETILL